MEFQLSVFFFYYASPSGVPTLSLGTTGLTLVNTDNSKSSSSVEKDLSISNRLLLASWFVS